ncbi:DUF4360 domain-containing protein [Amycolatopsis anabasis]|uniref:DUF4360 domain-containing protein n=1 Tax=Amycolatopsis anabasis TaxID=1840409 RepID=UPI00131BB3C5|nr:DUF4360 domain-containing protein [Amycolatopsis anabasis]
MLSMIAAAGVAMSLLTAPASAQPSGPPPDRITVDIVTVNGSGCPPGTAAIAVSSDNTAFTVTYSDYLAQAGAGASPTDFRKNCQLNLQVHYPQGFTYAIAKADYRGFAHLEKGASALERANYYFQGQSATERVSHTFNGPFSDDWQTTDQTDWASLVWAPCGEYRNLNVNTELRVNAGSARPDTTSFISMDSTDGSVKTTYHFAWKRCDA